MANFQGPFLPIDWLVEPFSGGVCPTIKAVKTEGIIYGPGWQYPTSEAGNYSAACNTSYKYILHHIETTRSDTNYVNQPACPGSWGNQQGIVYRQSRWSATVPAYDTYSNSLAEWNDYHSCVQNPDGTWNYTKTIWRTHQYYSLVNSFDNVCPTGTVYNPLTGTCDILEDYIWDPETQSYISDKCLIVDGPESICSNGTYTYTIGHINRDTLEPVSVIEDTLVYLSYPSGSIKNHLHFTAPTSVIMEAGTSEVSFDLVLYNNSNNGYFNIMPTSDLIGSCDGALNVILECEEEDTPDSSLPGYCCTYVPKDFIDWKSCEEFHEPYGHIVSTASDQIDNDGEPCGTSCSFFTNKFETWMSCTKFDEPEYPGNMLKDGTILE